MLYHLQIKLEFVCIEIFPITVLLVMEDKIKQFVFS